MSELPGVIVEFLDHKAPAAPAEAEKIGEREPEGAEAAKDPDEPLRPRGGLVQALLARFGGAAE